MRRKLRHLGVVTLVLGVVGLGCTRSAVQHKEPPDPLLVTKKPVEGRQRPDDAEPAHEAPAPPAPPPHETPGLSVQGDGPDPTRPVLLGVEPAGGPTGR